MAKEYKHILLVEGKSDVKFFQTLLQFEHKELDIKTIHFEVIGGNDNNLLTKSIRSLLVDLKKEPIENFGIVLDLDEFSKEDRQGQIVNVLQNLFGTDNVKGVNKKKLEQHVNASRTVNVYTYFIEDQLTTNLELLLKNIATVDPIAANCLELWKNCSTEAGRKIRQSDYMKFWREVYIRYDYCADKELRKHATDNCTTDKSYENMLIDDKPKAWNFDAVELNEIKTFLSNFAQ